jgi:pimeloyl-ACP methyl ester carboxylesterase
MPGGRSPQIFSLSTRVYPERGGPVRNIVEDRDGLRRVDCRHLLILVHGFNNTETKATESYGIMFAQLEEHFRYSAVAPDAVAFLHWPGNHAVGATGILDVFGYDIDIYNARQSSRRLADFLTGFHRPPTSPLKVTFLGHSMGCRLILETLVMLADENSPRIEVVGLMAPAVPVDLLRSPASPNELPDVIGRLRSAFRERRRILKFFSKSDWVLWLGFPRGQQLAYWSNIEPIHYREAVGLYGGPDGIGESRQTTNGHSDYWKDEKVADQYKAALDPTFRRLPAPRQLGERGLDSFEGPEARRLVEPR